jgi:hypothetical protein
LIKTRLIEGDDDDAKKIPVWPEAAEASCGCLASYTNGRCDPTAP